MTARQLGAMNNTDPIVGRLSKRNEVHEQVGKSPRSSLSWYFDSHIEA